MTTVTTPTVVALNPSTNISISTAFVAADWYIKVAWASSDLNDFKPASAPLLTSVSQTASTASLPSSNGNSSTMQTPGPPPSRLSASNAGVTTSAATTSAHSNAPNGLSTGAEAGIGVGASIAGLLLIAAVTFFLLRNRRHRKVRDSAPAGHGMVDAKNAPEEKDSQRIHEAHGDSRLAEADSSNVRAELEGNWHGHEVR